jgi:hypothetical protein
MAANPQLVTADTTITYDGVSQRVTRGTVIDVPAGSALATALSGFITPVASGYQNSVMAASYGSGNLENVTGNGVVSSYAGQ